MAGVGLAPSTCTQLALFATLRWQIFRNSLLTRRGRAEMASFLLLVLVLGLAALGCGIGLGALAFFALQNDKPELLTVALWPVFLCWQILPIFVSAAAAQFEFSNLLHFPLRFTSFSLLSLAYGLFDPAAVAALLWLACIAVGMALTRLSVVVWVIPTLLLFAAVNLLLSRMIFSWLERWLALRRTREVLGFLFLLVMFSLQLAGPVAERWGNQAAPWVQHLKPLSDFLPPGLAGHALADAADGHPRGVLTSTAALAAYAIAFALALFLRLRAQYVGESLSEEGQAPSSRPAAVAIKGGWSLPSFWGPIGALVEKELRYLFRNAPTLLTLISPLLLVLVIGHRANRPNPAGDPFARSPELVFAAGVGLATLSLTGLASNNLGFDGYGVQLLLLAPIRFWKVVLAKNLTLCIALAVEIALVWPAASFVFRPPGATVVLTTLLALPFALCLNFSVGNLLSLYFPRRLHFGGFRRQGASGVAIVISFGVQLLVLGVAGATLVWARTLGRLSAAAFLFLALGVASASLYIWVLRRCDRLALECREVLTTELCR